METARIQFRTLFWKHRFEIFVMSIVQSAGPIDQSSFPISCRVQFSFVLILIDTSDKDVSELFHKSVGN